ncbi:cob(I)yrinic acid a,c-diamide adenosyltransferase [Clostridium paraputrificum]|uniref:cob(I)yrinic acid a,c-diamide adenosyltransferase n=1 Tax=Clostridium TaxID=1485 RepID=UPI003D34B33E
MIQIYTGDGKGKTTAAIGQGIRAAGNDLEVYMVQFLKGGVTGELETVKKIPNFKIFRFEKPKDFVWNLKPEEIEELKKEIKEAYKFIIETIETKKCDVLIIDEIMGVLSNGFLTKEEACHILDINKENIEIIMTGRNVPEYLVERADLVTEMKMIKHYYEKGVPARKGIEF